MRQLLVNCNIATMILKNFPILTCVTPDAWIERALQQPEILLIDHAHCEKKAASTALALIYRYPQHHQLVVQLSHLAREELCHFEQVLKIMRQRNITFQHLAPARYAQGLLRHARTHEPAKLIDTLLIAAFVEARSCERFAVLVPHLDAELAKFYQGLLASEARHYQHYIEFAERFAQKNLQAQIDKFTEIERQLIEFPDEQFRFHSGV